jgi:hypothetical protein
MLFRHSTKLPAISISISISPSPFSTPAFSHNTMPILALLGQCAAMFAASLLVGALPLMLKSTLSSASAPRIR